MVNKKMCSNTFVNVRMTVRMGCPNGCFGGVRMIQKIFKKNFCSDTFANVRMGVRMAVRMGVWRCPNDYPKV